MNQSSQFDSATFFAQPLSMPADSGPRSALIDLTQSMISLDKFRAEKLKFIHKGSERIVVAALYGKNRPPQFADYQRKVFAHLEIPINQILGDFSRFEHGSVVDCFLKKLKGAYDYLVLFDTDAVPLRRDFIEIAYDKIRDKRTLFGVAQQSNHIAVNNSKNHVYVGPAALAISRLLYERLGCPSFLRNWRSDTAEELTWRAEEEGYTVAVLFPSHVHRKLWDLGNGHSFGIGTTYGDAIYHAFVQEDKESRRVFVKKCKEILTLKRVAR